MMKHNVLTASVLAMATLAASPASSQLAGTPKTVFSCDVGKKKVWITATGSVLTYHFGTPQKEELNIVASPTSGNVKAFSAHGKSHARFINGEYSYKVWSSWSNPSRIEGQEETAAGLTVYRGRKPISELSCARYADVNVVFSDLPDDDDFFVEN
jgi:hypothetical protein